MSAFKWFGKWLNCATGSHNWTCAANEGIKATKAQLEGGIKGFKDYAKMYCKDCGKVYRHKRL